MVYIPKRKPQRRSGQLGTRSPNFQATISQKGMQYQAWGNILDNLSNKLAPAMLEFHKEERKEKNTASQNNADAEAMEVINTLAPGTTPEDATEALNDLHESNKTKDWYNDDNGLLGSKHNLKIKSLIANYNIKYFREQFPKLIENKKKNADSTFDSDMETLSLSNLDKSKRLSSVNNYFQNIKENQLAIYKIKNRYDLDQELSKEEIEDALSSDEYKVRVREAENRVLKVFDTKFEEEIKVLKTTHGLDDAQVAKIILYHLSPDKFAKDDSEKEKKLKAVEGIDGFEDFNFLNEIKEMGDKYFGKDKADMFKTGIKQIIRGDLPTSETVSKAEFTKLSLENTKDRWASDRKNREETEDVKKAQRKLLNAADKGTYNEAATTLKKYGVDVASFAKRNNDKAAAEINSKLNRLGAESKEFEKKRQVLWKLLSNNKDEKGKPITKEKAKKEWEKLSKDGNKLGLTTLSWKEQKIKDELASTEYADKKVRKLYVEMIQEEKKRNLVEQEKSFQKIKRINKVEIELGEAYKAGDKKAFQEKRHVLLYELNVDPKKIRDWSMFNEFEDRSKRTLKDIELYTIAVTKVMSGELKVYDVTKQHEIIDQLNKMKFQGQELADYEKMKIYTMAQKFGKIQSQASRNKIQRFIKDVNLSLTRLNEYHRPSPNQIKNLGFAHFQSSTRRGSDEAYFPKLKSRIERINVDVKGRLDVLIGELGAGEIDPNQVNDRINDIFRNNLYVPLKEVVSEAIQEGFVDKRLRARRKNKGLKEQIEIFMNDSSHVDTEERREFLKNLEHRLLDEYKVRSRTMLKKGNEQTDRKGFIRGDHHLKTMQKAIIGLSVLSSIPQNVENGAMFSKANSELSAKEARFHSDHSRNTKHAVIRRPSKGK